MKKFVLFICFELVYFLSSAQPVLNSNEMLPFGSALHWKYSNSFSIVDTSVQGANSVWNFSGILNNSTLLDLYDTMVDPSTTPYGALFPNANYAYKEKQGTAIGYRYFNKTASVMERVGSYTTGANYYNDPQIEYVFPLQLGSSSHDTWDNTNSSSGGTYDFDCIGYGTLTLPSHTYSNVLMVRARVTEGSLYDMNVYFWYSADNGAFPLEYFAGDGLFYPPFILYLDSLHVAGVNESSFACDLKFNNPVQDNFNLSLHSKTAGRITYKVINSMGETMLSDKIYIEAINSTNLSIDFSSLAPGIYFFTMQSENETESVRTLKLIKL